MNTETDVLDPLARRGLLVKSVPYVWAVVFAANFKEDQEFAVREADAAAAALISLTRAPAKPLEQIAVKLGPGIPLEDFRGWYRVCDQLRNSWTAGYTPPTDQQIQDAYISYTSALADFS
ncbi:hypothetical protein JH300_20045 [Xanthomonas campestris pv. campestris]|uniref:hypothetical protein n=1 Tax=Xanthomonas campestris TaxID=339 RepID=UPI002377FAA4|nr:hypothetical protein [Xanthomonas campestris]WDK35506.1 hypothetical protein JH300_20045 [Xanthomonas campestris pv. campestris]